MALIGESGRELENQSLQDILLPNLIISTSSTPTGILASKSAFETATGLTTYMYVIETNKISIGVKSNGSYTLSGNIFENNSQLASIKDFGQLASLEGTGTFKNSGLFSVDLPGLRSVGYNTFEGCTFGYFACPLLDASYTGTNHAFTSVATSGAWTITVVLFGSPFAGLSGKHFKANTYT